MVLPTLQALPTPVAPPDDYPYVVALLVSLLAIGIVGAVIAGRWVAGFGRDLLGKLETRAEAERKRNDDLHAEHRRQWEVAEQAKRDRGDALAKRIDDGNAALSQKIDQSIEPLEDRVAALEKQAIELDYRLRGIEGGALGGNSKSKH